MFYKRGPADFFSCSPDDHLVVLSLMLSFKPISCNPSIYLEDNHWWSTSKNWPIRIGLRWGKKGNSHAKDGSWKHLPVIKTNPVKLNDLENQSRPEICGWSEKKKLSKLDVVGSCQVLGLISFIINFVFKLKSN